MMLIIRGEVMIDLLKDNSLIITGTKVKEKLLGGLAKEHKLLNLKFMTLNEFTSEYFGTYDERALYFLIKKYGLNYDVAKKYLNNIYYDVPFLKQYYDVLIENNLLIFDDSFKKSLNNIMVIGYDNIDTYIKKELEKYNTEYISLYEGEHTPLVYGFSMAENEISFVASDIASKLRNADINDFYLILGNDSYNFEVKRIFNLYNLPVNFNSSKGIYGTETCKKFIYMLEETRNVTKAIEAIPRNDVYNAVIDVLNKYVFVSEVDDVYIDIIKEELKQKNIEGIKLNNAISVINFDDIGGDGYYYVLGFNQGVYPRLYHDDDLIKDLDKKRLGINTSLENLRYEKIKITNVINSTPNLVITFKEKDNYLTFYPSPLIKEMGLNVIFNPAISFDYSNRYNEYSLAVALDNLIKFNEKSPSLDLLLNSYPDIKYQIYDNKFSGVSFDNVNKLLKGKMNLSYSTINNYFSCAFRFYIQNVLKLDPYEEKFATTVGNLFHYVLSHMYDDNFDLEKSYKFYLKDKILTEKEKYFTDKLYSNLEFVIDTIRKQEEYSKFSKVMTEQRFELDMSSKLAIKFVGVVDKIKYMEEEEKALMAIIDYKTGPVPATLDNINYGLHLQLPVYIYLVKNGIHKDISIAGFYLQKILQNKDMDTDDNDLAKKLKLDGYTINNEDIIKKFDYNYSSSEVIKSMGTTRNGFSKYAKVISEDEIDIVTDIVQDKIGEVIKNMETGNFEINPKRLGDKIVGCDFCKFRDLCYRKEEDIVNLIDTKFKDIVSRKE